MKEYFEKYLSLLDILVSDKKNHVSQRTLGLIVKTTSSMAKDLKAQGFEFPKEPK